jgi:hypothetical protein
MTLDKTANQLIDQQALLYFSMTNFPSEEDAAVPQQMTCYRSKYGISWKSAKNGLWMGYSFQIIGC